MMDQSPTAICHSSEEGFFITRTQAGHRFVRISYAQIAHSIADIYCCVMILVKYKKISSKNYPYRSTLNFRCCSIINIFLEKYVLQFDKRHEQIVSRGVIKK
jgi:hypothetical protein